MTCLGDSIDKIGHFFGFFNYDIMLDSVIFIVRRFTIGITQFVYCIYILNILVIWTSVRVTVSIMIPFFIKVNNFVFHCYSESTTDEI